MYQRVWSSTVVALFFVAACGKSSTPDKPAGSDKATGADKPAGSDKPAGPDKPAAAPDHHDDAPPPPADWSKANGYTAKTIALPGGTADGVFIDYLLYDPRTKAVWVPAGNTGSVDVIDTATGKLTRIDGFPTQEMERRGRKRVVGPSSATLGGDGVVYVGNRGDFTVCAIDDVKLTKGTCGKLDSMPDGLAYVARTKEVWVTTPRDNTIRVLDAATLAQKDKLTFEGNPEGFAVDATRNRFYTNLEDKDVTLAIDLASHKTVATWKPGCGEDGPHGIRLAEPEGLLFVACSTKAETMDVGHDGAIVGSIDTGDGVDDLDYSAAKHQLYVAAGRVATVTIASIDAKGALAAVAVVPTGDGARNGVADGDGDVYVSHAKASEIIVVSPPKK